MPYYGVNPRGLIPNDLWQMDVTHILSCGRLQFVHVTIDTCSGFIWATCASAETSTAVQHHLLNCFAVMNIPRVIKTDNAPAYTSSSLQRFLQQFNIQLKTGIPYNPQGQGTVERAHQSLKTQLAKIKKGGLGMRSPHALLSHAIYVLNFLQMDIQGLTAADLFWNHSPSQHPMVHWKDPLTGR